MLWNVDKNKSDKEAQANLSAANDQVVRKNATGTTNSAVDSSKKIMGHALSIKEEFVRQPEDGDEGPSSFRKLLEICKNVRESAAATLNKSGSKVKIHSKFLDSTYSSELSGQHCFFPIQGYDTDKKQPVMLMLPTEQVELSFIRAIDQQKIESWQHFEYLLSFILENRLLRIYQVYYSTRTNSKLEGLSSSKPLEHLSAERTEELIQKKQRQNRKKKEARKKKKSCANKQEESKASEGREGTDRRSESCASSLKRAAGGHSRVDEIRRSIAARLIQRTWQKYNCLRNEMRSVIEDIAIVDYTFRNEKLFDFTQIEIDESLNSRQ